MLARRNADGHNRVNSVTPVTPTALFPAAIGLHTPPVSPPGERDYVTAANEAPAMHIVINHFIVVDPLPGISGD
jgi:hypothetical protein